MKASLAHASPDEVALYVIDGMAQPARQRFEAHVTACPSCAGALASEAAAEQTLRALWPSVSRPLAEVVPLPRPENTRASAPRSTRSTLGLQGSFGGLAAAVVAVLFFGWWMDAGQMVRTRDVPAGDRLASQATCYLPGAALFTRGSGEARIYGTARSVPSLAGLASWGMCVAAPAFSGGLCGVDPDLPLGLMCALSEAQ